MTPNTITDVDAIMYRIDEAREQGYGFGVGQALPQEISVAAPVLDSRGYAVAAVQVPVYLPQWSAEEAQGQSGDAMIIQDQDAVISAAPEEKPV